MPFITSTINRKKIIRHVIKEIEERYDKSSEGDQYFLHYLIRVAIDTTLEEIGAISKKGKIRGYYEG